MLCRSLGPRLSDKLGGGLGQGMDDVPTLFLGGGDHGADRPLAGMTRRIC